MRVRLKDNFDKTKIYLVVWEDSRHPTSIWEHVNEFNPYPVIICKTVGYLVGETDTLKCIALSIGDIATDDDSDIQIAGVTQIPIRSIISMECIYEDISKFQSVSPCTKIEVIEE